MCRVSAKLGAEVRTGVKARCAIVRGPCCTTVLVFGNREREKKGRSED